MSRNSGPSARNAHDVARRVAPTQPCRCRKFIAEHEGLSSRRPQWLPDKNVIEETFFVEGRHYFVEQWTLQEFRDTLLQLHGPANQPVKYRDKRYYECEFCHGELQKHRMNLHRHHGCPKETRKVKPWPTLPWADVNGAVEALKAAKTDQQILAIFEGGEFFVKVDIFTGQRRSGTTLSKKSKPRTGQVDESTSDEDDDQTPSRNMKTQVRFTTNDSPVRRRQCRSVSQPASDWPVNDPARMTPTRTSGDEGDPRGKDNYDHEFHAKKPKGEMDAEMLDSLSNKRVKEFSMEWLHGMDERGDLKHQEVFKHMRFGGFSPKAVAPSEQDGPAARITSRTARAISRIQKRSFPKAHAKGSGGNEDTPSKRKGKESDKLEKRVKDTVREKGTGLPKEKESGDDLERQRRLMESRARHEAELYVLSRQEYPLPVDIHPPRHRPVTGLYLLLEHRLLGIQQWGQFNVLQSRLALTKWMAAESAKEVFEGAVGRFLMSKCLAKNLGDEACGWITVLMEDFGTKPWRTFRGFWEEQFEETGLYVEYRAAWEKFDMGARQRSLQMQAVQEQQRDFVRVRLAAFDRRRHVEEEGRRWGFNALYHYCALNPLVGPKLPEFPWTHNSEEANFVVNLFVGTRTKRSYVPAMARLAKLYMLCNGHLTGIKGLCSPGIIEKFQEWATDKQSWVGAMYLFERSNGILFGSEALDVDEEELTGDMLRHHIGDVKSAHRERLVNFIHNLQRRALEDTAQHDPNTFAKYWQITNINEYTPFEDLFARCRMREDDDMEFILPHNWKPSQPLRPLATL